MKTLLNFLWKQYRRQACGMYGERDEKEKHAQENHKFVTVG